MDQQGDALRESVTILYRAMRSGDKSAENRLFEQIYNELRHRARILLFRERPTATSTARGLVREAYFKLSGSLPEVQDRQHLLNLITKIMRELWVDAVRRRQAQKRAITPSTLNTKNRRKADLLQHRGVHLSAIKILEVDEALDILSKADPRGAKLLELYYFFEYSIDEIAEQCEIPKSSAHRSLKIAQARLAKILQSIHPA